MLTAKGAQTRDRILDSTADLVVRHGVAHTSLDDVCRATATSKSQLFHYFPDGRAQLLAEVEAREAHRILDDQRPFLEALDSWAAWDGWAVRVEAMYAGKLHGCPVAELSGSSAAYRPAGVEPVVAMYGRWLGAMRDGLAAMQGAGLLRPDVDPDELAVTTLATIQGGVVIMQALSSLRPLEIAVAAALAHVRSQAAH